jgi:two-component system chemotaxis response regulator CheB
MAPIRVLVVDDSSIIRRIVTEVLAADPDLEVVGFASNGRLALARIPQLNPDLLVLDVEMPEMSGLEALATLRKTWPRLPVIMYSTLTHRGAAATLDALALGANDYVTKPAGQESPEAARRRIGADLIPRIKALCRRDAATEASEERQRARAPVPAAARIARPPTRLDLLVIGTSTGGPNALAQVVPALPAGFPAPVLIVQHMPAVFTAMLAERLALKARLPVREATDGAPLRSGEAWVAPGDFHMVVAGGAVPYLKLTRDPPENSCRPSVDPLFRSAAAAFGPGVLGVVLTGMGEDGLRGCREIHERGGTILAQDEATSVVWGMPGYVARAGLAARVLPIDQIGPAIAQMAARPRPATIAAP